MLIGELGGAPSPGRPGQEAQLHQVGFIYVFQSHSLFANGGSQGFQAYGAAAIILNDGSEHSAVYGVQAEAIHFQPLQGQVGSLPCDDAVGANLGKIPNPAQEPVGDSGCAPAPGGNLLGALWVNFHAQEGGGPGDDPGELLGGVQLQPQGYAKPVPQ